MIASWGLSGAHCDQSAGAEFLDDAQQSRSSKTRSREVSVAGGLAAGLEELRARGRR
ncbi:hypothetical protein OHA59_44045 [Streptomyces sp. NBC_01589]|uniref:hypothetical protein n=1 Tax=Streptomyces sp. NBC_01589 TaxID=2975886 RepID=UPI003865FE84